MMYYKKEYEIELLKKGRKRQFIYQFIYPSAVYEEWLENQLTDSQAEVKALKDILAIDSMFPDENKQLKAENKALKHIIKSALAIDHLWVPKVVKESHRGEAEALHLMRDTFLNILEPTEPKEK